MSLQINFLGKGVLWAHNIKPPAMLNPRPFVVLTELKDFIIPLNSGELLNLEKSLRLEGCRDPLIIWQRTENELVVVDGYHRYRICKTFNIPFNYKIISFEDIEQVKIWMIENQIGRRNLTKDQMSYYRGLKYLSLKRRKGGVENARAKGKLEDSTSEMLSKEFNVSASTIKRDSKFAEGLNLISKYNSALGLKVLTGQLKIGKTRIQGLSRTKNPNAMVERWLKGDLITTANGQSLDVQLANSGSIRKIRGMILSTINRVIVNKDPRELDELRSLVNKLEGELFGQRGIKNPVIAPFDGAKGTYLQPLSSPALSN